MHSSQSAFAAFSFQDLPSLLVSKFIHNTPTREGESVTEEAALENDSNARDNDAFVDETEKCEDRGVSGETAQSAQQQQKTWDNNPDTHLGNALRAATLRVLKVFCQSSATVCGELAEQGLLDSAKIVLVAPLQGCKGQVRD